METGQSFNVAVRVLVCQWFLNDVDVVARSIHFTERLEVSKHVVFDVWAQHVLEQSREIFQLERVTRYGELELPISKTRRNCYYRAYRR